MGDRFSQVAVLTLILQLTGAGPAVGAASGVRVVPYLLSFGWAESLVNIQLGLRVVAAGYLLEHIGERTLGFLGGSLGISGSILSFVYISF
ncbi:hypothetical protein [Halobacillus litoralis]|uniref:hypothetical protein n=1 Tax=Halobacillus litoralis TaxID=45668 RepID=UPI002491D8C7|nr:hypothetical protein [Halobacillus litoralis]